MSSTELDVTFLNYHPSSGVTARLCAAIGLPAPIGDVAQSNRSMSGFGLIGLLAAHRLNLSNSARDQVFDKLQNLHDLRLWGGASFPFSRGVALNFLQDVVAPDLEWTVHETGIDLRKVLARPPKRFTLSEDDITALESCFEDLSLKDRQRQRLSGIFRRFQPESKQLNESPV